MRSSKALSLLYVAGVLFLMVGCGPQAEQKSGGQGAKQTETKGAPASATGGSGSVSIMVQEPSFENGTEGWGGVSIARSSEAAYAHTGKFGLLVTTNAKNPWGGAIYGEERLNVVDGKTLPVEPNSEYIASVWVKGVENFAGVPVLLQAVGPKRTSLGSAQVQLSGQWQQITLRFRARANVNHVGFNIVKMNSPAAAKFAIDDLEVNPATK
jgi:hypothetical protein